MRRFNLSPNLTYKEAVRSFTARNYNINNEPGTAELLNMFILAQNCFQPIRDEFNVPIYVSSFYRSRSLNTKVGGSTNSDHVAGCAIDLDADVFGKITNKQIFEFVKGRGDFKTLIWEFGDDSQPDWIHISYKIGYNHQNNIYKAEYNSQGEKEYNVWN